MIHLFSNVYMRPFELGLLKKNHSYVLKTDSYEISTSLIKTHLAKPLDLQTVEECVSYSEEFDERIVIYVGYDELKDYLSRLIKTIFPDCDQEFMTMMFRMYKNTFCMNWYLTTSNYILDSNRLLTLEEFSSGYFNSVPLVEDVEPFNVDMKLIGIEWKLWDHIMGEKKHCTSMKKTLTTIAKASASIEINEYKIELEKTLLAIEQDWLKLSDEGFAKDIHPVCIDPKLGKSATVIDYVEKEYGFNMFVGLGDKFTHHVRIEMFDKIITKKGRFPTPTEILNDILGPNDLNTLSFHIEQGFINPYIILLAKQLKKEGEIKPIA